MTTNFRQQGHPRLDLSGRLPCLSQICRGLLPMLYRIDRNPDWKVFLNMVAPSQATTAAPTGELDLMVPALEPKLSASRPHTAKQVVDVPLRLLLCGLGTVDLSTPAKQADLSYGETCAGFCSSTLIGDPLRPRHECRTDSEAAMTKRGCCLA